MNTAGEPSRLWSFEFIFLLVVSFVNMGAFGMAIPIFPAYAVSLGATITVAGVVTGIFSFVALIGRPFSAVMGDRLNKKKLLIASLVLNGFFTLLYAITPNLAWVVPVRIIHALMFSVSGTVSFALGAEYIPKARMGEGVGYMGIGQILGMAIGPNISIFVAERYSYRLSFGISGAVIMLAGLMVFALRYTYTAPAVKRSFRFQDFLAASLLPNAFFAAIFMLGNGLTSSFLVMIGAERGIENVGLFFIVNAAVVLVSRPLAGRLADRKGFAFVILPGYILAAGAMFAIAIGHNNWFVVLAAFLFAMGAGTSMPAIQADCLTRLGRERSGVATGTYFIGLDIGMTIGPVVGGAMADNFGFTTTFTGAAALMLAGFCAYLAYKRLTIRRRP